MLVRFLECECWRNGEKRRFKCSSDACMHASKGFRVAGGLARIWSEALRCTFPEGVLPSHALPYQSNSNSNSNVIVYSRTGSRALVSAPECD